jgi:two-component system OmpR family response regulator
MSEVKTPCRLLIVDDNKDAARSLAILMGVAGYNVKTAFDGATALDVAASFHPAACILDIKMPGMNGYELARLLRKEAKDQPLVLAAVTACSDEEHLDLAVGAGFDLHFTKPADPAEVVEQLEKSVAANSETSRKSA